MRKSLWIVCVLLLMGALGAPYAKADAIVQVHISNLKFSGKNACPPPSGTAACTQTFTESFQWDDSNATYVSGSLSFSTSGDLGSTWSLQVAPFFDSSVSGGNSVHNTLIDPAGDLFDVLLGAPNGILTPGIYDLTSTPDTTLPTGMAFSILSCGGPPFTCAPLFSGTSSIPTTIGSVAVAFPEPGTDTLMLIGIGLVLVMRKRLARSLPQAT